MSQSEPADLILKVVVSGTLLADFDWIWTAFLRSSNWYDWYVSEGFDLYAQPACYARVTSCSCTMNVIFRSTFSPKTPSEVLNSLLTKYQSANEAYKVSTRGAKIKTSFRYNVSEVEQCCNISKHGYTKLTKQVLEEQRSRFMPLPRLARSCPRNLSSRAEPLSILLQKSGGGKRSLERGSARRVLASISFMIRQSKDQSTHEAYKASKRGTQIKKRFRRPLKSEIIQNKNTYDPCAIPLE